MFDYPFYNTKLSLEERVDDLLSRLTLEEKAGFVSSRQPEIERLGISEWHVGCEIARGYVGRSQEEPSTVLPQPIGMAAMFDPDLMLLLGELAGNETRVYYQKDKKGKLMLFGPTVDMERDPRWGRNEEAYGEDPYLTGKMSAAFTKGLKGEDPFYIRTVPGLKHFCANNNELDRGSCSANLEPRTKHEYYYKAFRPAIVEGGALSVMASYNEISGVPALLNPDLRSVLKDQWGLDFIVSDGGDFVGNVINHKYVDNHPGSIALAIKAGADIMLDDAELVKWSVLEAIKEGLLTERELDESIRREISIRFRLGEFDPKNLNPYANIPDNIVNCDAYKALNNKAAKEQVILLKNNGILPINKSEGKKLAVIGPLADKNYMDWYTGYSDYNISILEGINQLLGKESILYDNAYDRVAIKQRATGKYISVKDKGEVYADAKTVGEAEAFEYHDWDFGSQNLYSLKNRRFLREEHNINATGENTFEWFVREWLKCTEYKEGNNENEFVLNSWNDFPICIDDNSRLSTCSQQVVNDSRVFQKEIISSGIERAVKLAREAEVAIVCVGNDPLQVARECYDRPDIILPKHQSDLIKAVYEANPNTVVVVVSSYPYAINWEDQKIPAIVYTSHAGPELGNAIAEVLTGGYNPAGRTPMTWYKSIQELPDIKDYDIIKNDMTYLYFKGEPLYPFGYGLSYSSFTYSDFTLEYPIINRENSKDKQVLRAGLKVTNVSDKDGDEVVQLYFRAKNPRVKRPIRQLCGFKRVHIKAGESIGISFTVRESDLEFYDVTREKLCMEAGEYAFMVGASSADIRLEQSIEIKGEVIPVQTLRKETPAINYDDKALVRIHFSKEYKKHYVYPYGMGCRYIKFSTVDLSGAEYIELVAASHSIKAKLHIHLDAPDNPSIGCVEVPITGGPDKFVTLQTKLEPREGVHELYLVFEGDISLLNLRIR